MLRLADYFFVPRESHLHVHVRRSLADAATSHMLTYSMVFEGIRPNLDPSFLRANARMSAALFLHESCTHTRALSRSAAVLYCNVHVRPCCGPVLVQLGTRAWWA